MGTLIKSVAKKIGYVVAIFIILAATLAGAGRLLTPLVDSHRSDIEKLTSVALGVPVTIGNVEIAWHFYQPEIILNNVTIFSLPPATAPTAASSNATAASAATTSSASALSRQRSLLHLQQVKLFISIFSSLWQRQIVPSKITLTGTNVSIYKAENGEIFLQGFSIYGGEQPPDPVMLAKIINLLSQLSHIHLRYIDVNYSDFTKQKRFIQLDYLSLKNKSSKHILLGQMTLKQEIPTAASFMVEWSGNEIDINKLHAKIYTYVTGIFLPEWLKNQTWQGWQIKDGIASAKIWAIWHLGQFRKMQATVQVYGINLYSQTDKSTHMMNRLSGNIGWQRQGKKQIFAGDDILIDLPTHLWPVSSFYVAMLLDETNVLRPQAVNVGYIDLQDMQPFLFSSPAFLAENTRAMLTKLNIQGNLQHAVLTFNTAGVFDINQLSLQADINQLTFSPWEQWPAVRNISGNVKWNGKQGELNLHSNRAVLQYEKLFTYPIFFDQLSGNIVWQQAQDKSWLLQIANLQMLNNDGAGNVTGTITVPEKEPLAVDVAANLTFQKANRVVRYLPMHKFTPTLAGWLNQAFVSGEVSAVTAVLKGRLIDFPFDKGAGKFLIKGEVNNMDFRFAPDWPMLTQLNGTVVFSNRQVLIDAKRANILSIPLQNIHGEIPNLGGGQVEVLTVKVDPIVLDFSQGLQFIRKSPLATTIGKMFADIELKGPTTLLLQLAVPLGTPNKTNVNGDISFKNTSMRLVPWNLMVNQLQGQLNFTEDTTTAKNVQGQLFAKPIQLNISTVTQANQPSTMQVDFANKIDVFDLEDWLKIPFSKMVKGSTEIAGKINFSLTAPIQVQLNSNLIGIELNLPDEYAKTATETRDFSATIIVQTQQPLRVKLFYDKLLSAALILDRQKEKIELQSVNLRIGGGELNWPTGASGLYITGALQQLDWDKVKDYNNDASGTGQNLQFDHLPLREIDIMAQNVTFLGQHLTQARLQLIPQATSWEVDIDSREVAGHIQAPKNFSSKGLMTAKLQRLNITANGKQQAALSSASSNINMKSFPAISFTAQNVSYNNMPLGQVSFDTASTGRGIMINSLRVLSPLLELQATGNWSAASNMTHMQGTGNTSNLSDLLNSFGLDAHNLVASKGKVAFDLSWRGAPYAPRLGTVDGNASLDIGAGRVVEVGQASGAKMGIGRMLSIFSLQTIPRRLTFDFSDVFQKGYSFDSVRGEFKINDGDAFTKDLRFDGPVAKVEINGRIGLEHQDYDFILSVTPYVSSSIPLAATLLGAGPVVGAAVFVANAVLGSAISKVATYSYTVTGSWDNPKWETVDKTNNANASNTPQKKQ